jgi:hypothetical protein
VERFRVAPQSKTNQELNSKSLTILRLGQIRTASIHLCKQAVQAGNLIDYLFILRTLEL